MASKGDSSVAVRVKLSHGAERALSDLQSRREQVKRKAMLDLRAAVEMEARQMSRENFSAFITELNRRIFDLVKSEDPHEQLGGIFAMDALVDVECEESPTFITRFANYLRLILPCNNVPTMVMASRVLGHLAQAGGTLTADFVEFEVKRALEGLNSEKRSEHHRLAAVLVCKQLALNAPTLFFMHVAAYIKAVWAGIHDAKQLIREATIESLRACLGIIAQRDMAVRSKWFSIIFDEAERGQRYVAVPVVHGSLLVVGELLQLPEVLEAQMPDGFTLEQIYAGILRFGDHRDALLRKTVITLLPVVAQMDPDAFRVKFAADAIQHLITTLQKGVGDRPATFLALSTLLHTAGPQIVDPYRDEILTLVLDGITPTQRKPFVSEAATCIASLSALDPSNTQVHESMPELIEQMLAASEGNITTSLITALSEIARSMPLLLPDIQMKLLDVISFTLQRTPYQPSGTPNYRRIAPVRGGTPSTLAGHYQKGRETAVIQALYALAEFDFSGNQLCEFVQDCVALYLEDASPQVRLTAAKTSSRLLLRPGDAVPRRGGSSLVVSEVLEKLLVTAVSDQEPHIRLAVLECLGPRFDCFLAQASSIRSLFVAVNDEVFYVREAAIHVLGRLTLLNPAHVMPGLRRMLLQVLTALEFGGEEKREKSSRLLEHIILASQSLIKPYVAQVLAALVPKLQDPNPRVAAHVINTLGVISKVGSTEVLQMTDEIFPLMLDAIQDQSSSSKRRIATCTLGLLVQRTGMVIEPYTRYPDLLGVLLKGLQAEQSLDIRTELLKVLGVLGAIDPHSIKAIDTTKPQLGSTSIPGVAGGAAAGGGQGGVAVGGGGGGKGGSVAAQDAEALPGLSSEDYYPHVAVTRLIKILNEPSLSSYHRMVIEAVMFIFRVLGLRCVKLLPQVMDLILNLLGSAQQGLRDFLFQQLGLLVSIIKQYIRPYLDKVFYSATRGSAM